MIGMNDDTRFLTDSRHGQLLAEAETRRLVGNGGSSGNGVGAALHRLGSRLFGSDQGEAKSAVDVAPAPATPRLTRARTDEGTQSVAGTCTGPHKHGQAAA